AGAHAVRRHGLQRAPELPHVPAGALPLRRARRRTQAVQRRTRPLDRRAAAPGRQRRRHRPPLRRLAPHRVSRPRPRPHARHRKEPRMTIDTLPDNRLLVEHLPRLDGARMRAYRDNLAFYQGQQWPGTPRRRDRRLVFNYAKALIDKTASYLMSDVSFVVDEEDASEPAREAARRAERALREVYEANNLAQLDVDSEIDTSVLGDGAWKVTWDPDQRQVRVTAPDVQGLHAWWLGDDVSRVW